MLPNKLLVVEEPNANAGAVVVAVPKVGLLPKKEFVADGVEPKTLVLLVPKPPPKVVFACPNKVLFSVWGFPNKVPPDVAPNNDGCWVGVPNKLLCWGP